jgi:hypothetical protein
MYSGIRIQQIFNDFKTIVPLVGFLFIVVIADARNHEPEAMNSNTIQNVDAKKIVMNTELWYGNPKKKTTWMIQA